MDDGGGGRKRGKTKPLSGPSFRPRAWETKGFLTFLVFLYWFPNFHSGGAFSGLPKAEEFGGPWVFGGFFFSGGEKSAKKGHLVNYPWKIFF